MFKQRLSLIEYILLALIALGVIAALVDLMHNRSLWLDEAMLSLNIVNKPYSGLLSPLDMNQVAPIGFLYVEKLMASIFGNQDWSLKIFPFISYILSVPLLYVLSFKIFHSSKISLLACALFATNIFIIRYGSEVKQYSTDIFVMLLILNFSFNYDGKQSKNYFYSSALIGSLAIWFSNIAVIGLCVIGLYYIYTRIFYKKHTDNIIFIPIAFWLLSFAVYYYSFIYNHPTKAFMVEYWSFRNAFLPQNILSKEFYLFLFAKMKMIFPFLLGFKYNWIFSFSFFIIGLFSFSKPKNPLYLLLAPIFIHLLLSCFQLYPFDKRTVLYLIPTLLIFISAGVFSCHEMITKYGIKVPVFILFLILSLNLIHLYKKIPSENEEIKKSLDYIHQKIGINDHVYIYFVSEPAYLFYNQHYINLKNRPYSILGDWKMKSWVNFENQISSIKGKSWIVFTEVYDIGGLNGEHFIIDKLINCGGKVLSSRKFTGSSCYEIYK